MYYLPAAGWTVGEEEFTDGKDSLLWPIISPDIAFKK